MPQPLGKLSLIVGLMFTLEALALLSPIEDEELRELSGATGVAIALENIQLIGGNDTTLFFDMDDDSSNVYLDHIRLYKFNAASPGTIADANGVDYGTFSDPIALNIATESFLQKNVGLNTYSNKDISYISLSLPSAGVINNTTFNAQGISVNSVYADTAGKLTWGALPNRCSGIDCISFDFRSRMDLFRPKSAWPNAAVPQLYSRDIQWWSAQGLNVHGSEASIWADPEYGFAMALDVTAYIDSIGFTRKTNTSASTKLTAGEITAAGLNNSNTNRNDGETIASVNNTAPYSTNDQADWSSPASNLLLSGIHVDLNLGNEAYQPLIIQSVVTPLDRAVPSGSCSGGGTSVTGSDGSSYCPDDITLNLELRLEKIPNINTVYNAFYAAPKSNIYINDVSIGGQSFGSSTIEGLQIQYLSFKTQDLTPLINAGSGTSHCPPGWACSF